MKVVLNTSFHPYITFNDDWFFKKLLVLPFDVIFAQSLRERNILNWCLSHTEIFSKSIQKYSMCYGRWQSTFFTRLDVILILLKSAFDKFQCAMAVGNLFSNSSFHPFMILSDDWFVNKTPRTCLELCSAKQPTSVKSIHC